jgi:hypothetical protein
MASYGRKMLEASKKMAENATDRKGTKRTNQSAVLSAKRILNFFYTSESNNIIMEKYATGLNCKSFYNKKNQAVEKWLDTHVVNNINVSVKTQRSALKLINQNKLLEANEELRNNSKISKSKKCDKSRTIAISAQKSNGKHSCDKENKQMPYVTCLTADKDESNGNNYIGLSDMTGSNSMQDVSFENSTHHNVFMENFDSIPRKVDYNQSSLSYSMAATIGCIHDAQYAANEPNWKQSSVCNYNDYNMYILPTYLPANNNNQHIGLNTKKQLRRNRIYFQTTN